MNEKVIEFLGIIAWIIIFILMIKTQDKFWFGFLCGALTALTVGAVIIVIMRQEKRLK